MYQKQAATWLKDLKIVPMSTHLLYFLTVTILTYLAGVSLVLLVRALRVRFGERVKPDGSKAVVITGATSGLGLAAAKRLHARGFTVFACYHDNQKPGYRELIDLKSDASREVSNVLAANKGYSAGARRHLFLIKMDVRSGDSIQEAAREILTLLDEHRLQLHCVMNNAAVSCNITFELLSSEGIRNVLDTNLASVYLVSKAFTLRLIKDQGRLINVSSGVHFFPGKELSVYGSTKAALSYFSEALHQDLRPYGAACYTIVPGNLILQTNIMFSHVSLVQKSIRQLSADECELYKAKIEKYETTNGVYEARLGNTPEDPKRLAQLYHIELPDLRPANEANWTPKKQNLAQRLLALVVRLSDGGSKGNVELESTGAIDGYESAVVLRRPPRNTYAGNMYYQFISGPIFEHIPSSVSRYLGNHMMANLDASK